MEAPTTVVGPDEIDPFVGDWRALAADLDGTSYFQTPDWVLSWWNDLAGRPPTEFALWRGPDGSLDGVAAISLVRERVHPRLPIRIGAWVNSGSGVGAADHCGWVVRPHRVSDVRDWIRDRSGASVELRNLAPDSGYVPEAAERVDSTRCPRLVIPSESEPLGRSRNFRQQLRSRERKTAEAGIVFETASGPAVTEELLAQVVDLHVARSQTMGWATTFDRSRLPFHMRLVAHGNESRGPALVLARREGDVVGGLYGFWWKDTFAYYQLGWDESWAEIGLGTVLLAEAIQYARSQGGVVFDFLRGAEEFKYRFGATDVVDESWLVPSGVGGRVLAWKRRRREALAEASSGS